ncbi:phosphonate ABC transporter, permease protein PhnE [Aquincola sp. S2]|uniref:Phosphonate ABC transporter, permease protein PhnE n=1 Tax=Pseudaquabacterium terrae TaxID=2732868 RepID=A0ABX2EAB2_9BURK|nr:phosphonate ABC transporter, permease protein PhnE [Aquabacterium terrae]NRF65476.1 phosphonate ABC transporter, permease protein PhnE [Aquabacterium terrae]
MVAVSAPSTPFRASAASRAALLGVALYALYALSRLEVSWPRFLTGLDQGARLLGKMFPPDLRKGDILFSGMVESLQIAVLASLLGILISLPLGLLGARNLMPAGVSWTARGVVALCRSLHPVIVAILFVKAVGFGALAGVLALTVGSIGFIGKLFAEAIEEISPKQVEAVRATGASFANVVLFGVLPQVLSRFVGFATYQLDSNLRNSTMVGIVGAGGIGGALFAAFQRFDYGFVFTILATIVALILCAELLTQQVKKVFHV